MENITNAINSSETYSNFVQTTGGAGDIWNGGTGTTSFTNTCCNGCGGWYYSWYPHSCSESKTEKSYKVVRALMKAKLVKITTLNKFFELMDELMKVI